MIFLGCDGGSTKTEWLLADHTGRVLSHRIFEGCNYAFLGKEGFRALMEDSVKALLEDGGITAGQVTSAMLSLTVYGEVPGTEETYPEILGAILPGCPIQIDNDSVAGWGGSLAGRPGINIVAGTGSVSYGQDQSGKDCRVGGWSLFFADEGSCSWVARQMITEFVKQADGRHPRSAIYEELRREMDLTHDLYFSGYLQTEIRQNSALLARLQMVALRAAQRGDPAALEDLNGITHGFIGRALEEEMAKAEREGRPAAAIDAIALIESGLAAECEAVVGILAPAEVRVKRIMARDHIGEDYARARVAAQKDEAFYRAHCTHILENNENDTPETFRRRALALFRGLLEGD